MKSSDPASLLTLQELPPLILLTGGSDYDRGQVLQKLGVAGGFVGEELSSKVLAEELSSARLFSSKLVIRHITKLDAPSLKVLLTYVKNPNPKLTLILEGENGSTLLAKAFDEGGIHLDLGHLPPWEEEKAVAQWLCQEGGGRLTPQLARLMVERVGPSKQVLKGELDKLLCYAGERPSLTREDLDALLVGSVEGSVWELGRAIMGQDPRRALNILSSMGEGMGLFGTLAALRSQFQTGLVCASLVRRGAPLAEMQKALPKLKGRQLERMVEFARGYGEERFRKGLVKLGELEGRAKRQMLPERLALELLVTALA